MLYLATLEPPVSACALADQIGSTYQVAPTNGLSKRGPALVLVLEELELDLMLEDTELTTELELDFTLETELTTLDLLEDTELTTELTLDLLEDMELTTELDFELADETGQPATTPYGAG